jgi:hypothetical protein
MNLEDYVLSREIQKKIISKKVSRFKTKEDYDEKELKNKMVYKMLSKIVNIPKEFLLDLTRQFENMAEIFNLVKIKGYDFLLDEKLEFLENHNEEFKKEMGKKIYIALFNQ